MISTQKSLGRKVSLVVLVAISSAIVLTAAALGLFEYRAAELRIRANLTALAEISLAQFSRAVEFDLPEPVAEALSRLEASPTIMAATVFAHRGGVAREPFAGYVRKGEISRFAAAPRADGFYEAGNRLLFVSTYSLEGAPIATLQLEADLSAARRAWIASLRWLAVIAVIMIGIGWWLARSLERTLTRPILALVETAQAVEQSGNYSLRARTSSQDEIGQLAARFNAMLGGIGERDRQLALSAGFQRAILEASGVAVVSCRIDGLVTTFNPAAEQLLGYQAAEVVGRMLPVAWHDPAEIAARAAELSTRLGRVVAPGFEVFVATVKQGESDAREWTYVSKDGTRIPVWMVLSALTGTEGELTGYVGLASDLRERKAAEHALRDSEERHRIVVEQTGQMIYDVDMASSRIRWFGDRAIERITGYTPAEFATVDLDRWSQLIHPEDRPGVLEEFDRCAAQGEQFAASYRFQRKDGTWAVVQDYGWFIRDVANRVVRMLGAMADITEQHQADLALRTSEERYRLLAENSVVGMLVLQDGALCYANPRIVEMLGYDSPAQMMGRQFIEAILPEYREEVSDRLARVMRGEKVGNHPGFPARRRDGTVIWLQTGPSVTTWNGRPAFLSFVIDISERKESEERLRQSERKFATIFEQSPDLIFVASGEDGKLIDINGAFLEQTGWTRADVLGRTLGEIGLCAHPEVCATGMQTALAGGEYRAEDFAWRGREGSPRLGQLSVRRVEVNGRAALNCVLHDTTAQKRHERALRSFTEITAGVTGHEFFSAVVRQLCAELGVRYSLIGAISEGNPPSVTTLAAWADGAPAELTYTLGGTPCEKVAEQGICHFSDGVAERFPEDGLLRQMGVRSYAGIPIRSHTGQTLGLIAVLDDKPMPENTAASLLLVLSATRAAAEIQRVNTQTEILRLNADLESRVKARTTELAQRVEEVERLNREQQALVESLRASQAAADRSAARLQEVNANLIAANQELESFSYTVSHDLRAPLRNINGFLELLRKRLGAVLDQESDRFVGVVSTEVRRMGTLIDDLLTFSRIGRTELSIRPVALADLVADVRQELAGEIGERRIEWRLSPLPVVLGDSTLLRQVLANLLGNAVKFTRKRVEAVIEIGAQPGVSAEQRVTIFIRDNGAGFNPRYIDKLFGVFQRLHNARDFEGTGIGLANVKRIVTRHGGRVWAEGAPEKGAVFYFTLKTAGTTGNSPPPP